MLNTLQAITITDEHDARIAPYRQIRERDLVGRDGHFIAEGEVVLRVLLTRSHHKPASILVDTRRLEKLAPLLALAPSDTPVYTADAALLDTIAGFHIHRGILALGVCAPLLPAEALLQKADSERPLVVLCGIANHDNLGGIFRNAAALGAHGILLDAFCCNPFYRKALRVSVGAALCVPFARLSPNDALLPLLKRHGFTPLALSPQGETSLDHLKPAPRTALILGTEGLGLPPAIMADAHTVSIPMADNFDSLNVATTSGIVLHHLRKISHAMA